MLNKNKLVKVLEDILIGIVIGVSSEIIVIYFIEFILKITH